MIQLATAAQQQQQVKVNALPIAPTEFHQGQPPKTVGSGDNSLADVAAVDRVSTETKPPPNPAISLMPGCNQIVLDGQSLSQVFNPTSQAVLVQGTSGFQPGAAMMPPQVVFINPSNMNIGPQLILQNQVK